MFSQRAKYVANIVNKARHDFKKNQAKWDEHTRRYFREWANFLYDNVEIHQYHNELLDDEHNDIVLDLGVALDELKTTPVRLPTIENPYQEYRDSGHHS